MRATLPALLAVALTALPAVAAPFTVKTVKDTAPPEEVAAPIRKLLGHDCVQLIDGEGTRRVEVWFRREVPVRATAAQIDNGLTYAEVPGSTVLGAVRLEAEWVDYRKQKVPAGVYTLRLAEQPRTGDHAGTAPYPDFCLMCPAADDKKPDLLEPKSLQELSARATGVHPCVLLLFPGKGAARGPKLVDRGTGHRVLLIELAAKAGARKAALKIGLTLVGASAGA